MKTRDELLNEAELCIEAAMSATDYHAATAGAGIAQACVMLAKERRWDDQRREAEESLMRQTEELREFFESGEEGDK